MKGWTLGKIIWPKRRKKKFTTHYQSSDKAQHTERRLRKGV
jgi:hypothetical protein